jgi:hypothetical protein
VGQDRRPLTTRRLACPSCGLDVSRKSTHVYIEDARGRRVTRGIVATTPTGLAGAVERYTARACVAIEAGNQTAWIVDLLRELGAKVHGCTRSRRVVEQAIPDDTVPRYLLRDRDRTHGDEFARRVKRLGFREVPTVPRAPWQNPFVERVISSIRCECLITSSFCARPISAGSYGATSVTTTPRGHTNRSTTTVPRHESSNPRHVGRIIAIPQGLHHCYQRVA